MPDPISFTASLRQFELNQRNAVGNARQEVGSLSDHDPGPSDGGNERLPAIGEMEEPGGTTDVAVDSHDDLSPGPPEVPLETGRDGMAVLRTTDTLLEDIFRTARQDLVSGQMPVGPAPGEPGPTPAPSRGEPAEVRPDAAELVGLTNSFVVALRVLDATDDWIEMGLRRGFSLDERPIDDNRAPGEQPSLSTIAPASGSGGRESNIARVSAFSRMPGGALCLFQRPVKRYMFSIAQSDVDVGWSRHPFPGFYVDISMQIVPLPERRPEPSPSFVLGYLVAISDPDTGCVFRAACHDEARGVFEVMLRQQVRRSVGSEGPVIFGLAFVFNGPGMPPRLWEEFYNDPLCPCIRSRRGLSIITLPAPVGGPRPLRQQQVSPVPIPASIIEECETTDDVIDPASIAYRELLSRAPSPSDVRVVRVTVRPFLLAPGGTPTASLPGTADGNSRLEETISDRPSPPATMVDESEADAASSQSMLPRHSTSPSRRYAGEVTLCSCERGAADYQCRFGHIGCRLCWCVSPAVVCGECSTSRVMMVDGAGPRF